MLSSNWHVTLRLTVFETSAVKWPNLGPKFQIWEIPGGTAPKRGEDLSRIDMYHHAKFHAIGATIAEGRDISHRTEKTF